MESGPANYAKRMGKDSEGEVFIVAASQFFVEALLSVRQAFVF